MKTIQIILQTGILCALLWLAWEIRQFRNSTFYTVSDVSGSVEIFQIGR